jgi:MoCo/4Fe-4S cofactor protein with predicted Tat translocation signal
MKHKEAIWIGEKDLNRDRDFEKSAQKEFHTDVVKKVFEGDGMTSNRRDFLKYLGFSLGAATIAAGCEIPVRRAIPYVIKPDEIVPGVATYYASTFVEGGDYCPVLVKTREGRPIKVEGNALSPITSGGTSARAQAMVLSLYDTNRLRGPARMQDGEPQTISWRDLDNEVKQGLNDARQIALVTNTIMSPTLKNAIAEFEVMYPNLRHVTVDEVSSSAMLLANEQMFGERVIPNYSFDKAKVIVSFNADFLGTWISPVEFASDYSKNRKIEDPHHAEISRHIQVESHMSLTGSNADNRILVKPSEQGAAIATLYNAIAAQSGQPSIPAPQVNAEAAAALDRVASELIDSRGASLVVSGSNVVDEQILVNKINVMLANYGETLDLERPSYQRQGVDSDLQELISDMSSGQVDAVIFMGANPAYGLPNAGDFQNALANVGLKISTARLMDETTQLCDFLAPDHHNLEAWGDVEAKRGQFSLIQPTISPLFDTRQVGESLLTWCESPNHELLSDQPYMEYVKKYWEENIFPAQNEYSLFQAFWDRSLHDGIFELPVGQPPAMNDVDVSSLNVSQPGNSDLEVSFIETVTVGGGQYANNPWLQEMPDPVTRCVWGNYLAVPVSFDGVRNMVGFQDLKDGDIVELTVNGTTERVTVIQQFGQMPGTVSIQLGYGRREAGFCGTGVGVDTNPWHGFVDNLTQYFATDVQVSEKVDEEDIASVQYHHTMGVQAKDALTGEMINADEAATAVITMGLVRQGPQGSLTKRSIIRRTHVNDIEHFIEELHHEREHHQKLNEGGLYPDYSHLYKNGHHWGMHVDLNACIGCGACTVACMAENNVPVVGKRNVARHQEMTWLRIDRYYYGDLHNPNVVYQPLMCQHCDNAPCENVCPVNATNHSSEGLNQMAYNRCIGTRYCANNCPYKVRRLNWADYTKADNWPSNEPRLRDEEVPFLADNLTRMVLNPDVTVRSRGVMEKCSFCVQRIQEGKITAKKESRRLEDRDVRTACQTACPTGAITFGDRNNPEGQLSKKFENPLNYIVLEETNVQSSVNYTAKVNNRDESLDT